MVVVETLAEVPLWLKELTVFNVVKWSGAVKLKGVLGIASGLLVFRESFDFWVCVEGGKRRRGGEG